MTTGYFDPGSGNHVMIDGMIVEKDALRIAEKIKDYDPDLILITADPNDPEVSFTSAPFLVLKDKGNGVYERVLEAWKLDDQILERLWLSDGAKNNQLEILAKMELAKKAEETRQWEEKRGANKELATSIISSPQSSYKFKNKEGDLIKLHEDTGVDRNNGRKSFN